MYHTMRRVFGENGAAYTFSHANPQALDPRGVGCVKGIDAGPERVRPIPNDGYRAREAGETRLHEPFADDAQTMATASLMSFSSE